MHIAVAVGTRVFILRATTEKTIANGRKLVDHWAANAMVLAA